MIGWFIDDNFVLIGPNRYPALFKTTIQHVTVPNRPSKAMISRVEVSARDIREWASKFIDLFQNVGKCVFVSESGMDARICTVQFIVFANSIIEIEVMDRGRPFKIIERPVDPDA